MRPTIEYLCRRKCVQQHWIGGTGDHLRVRMLFPDLLLLRTMPRDPKAPDHRTSVESSVTVQRSAPRHLAPVIELKHGVLHGSDEDEIWQGVGPARAPSIRTRQL